MSEEGKVPCDGQVFLFGWQMVSQGLSLTYAFTLTLASAPEPAGPDPPELPLAGMAVHA